MRTSPSAYTRVVIRGGTCKSFSTPLLGEELLPSVNINKQDIYSETSVTIGGAVSSDRTHDFMEVSSLKMSRQLGFFKEHLCSFKADVAKAGSEHRGSMFIKTRLIAGSDLRFSSFAIYNYVLCICIY